MKKLKFIGILMLISLVSLTSCSIPFMKKEASDGTISESKTGLMQGKTTDEASDAPDSLGSSSNISTINVPE